MILAGLDGLGRPLRGQRGVSYNAAFFLGEGVVVDISEGRFDVRLPFGGGVDVDDGEENLGSLRRPKGSVGVGVISRERCLCGVNGYL